MRILLLILVLPFITNAQSLSPERVKRIKDATVRITIEGTNSTGTGFYINESGQIATCWHVISPAIIKDDLNKLKGLRKIVVENGNGEFFQYGIPIDFFTVPKLNENAVSYDFCLLIPYNQSPFAAKTPFLKLGNYDNVKEGDDVYTCGYPIGIKEKFISKGIVSNKHIDTSINYVNNNIKINKPRNQALLDITLNRGNSGGAVIKIGNSIEEDEVIGIADFIITPSGFLTEDFIKNIEQRSGGVQLGGIDPNAMFSVLSRILSAISIGVGGAVSINHFSASLVISK